MWHARRYAGSQVDEFQPPQADAATADEIVRLAEAAIGPDGGDSDSALDGLRRFVARSRGVTDERLSPPRGADDSVPALEPIRAWAGMAAAAVSGASEYAALR